MDKKRVQVVIWGWVQGVGFRAACQRQANALGLAGWVRNRSDGAVEALFEGAEPDVEAMVRWCHQGPASAEVTDVQVRDAPPGPVFRSFQVRM